MLDTRMAKRVLVYNIGMLGDTVVTIPAHRAIRRHFGPEAHVSIFQLNVGPNRISPFDILSPLGLVDGHVEYERGGPLRIKEALSILEVRKGRFDAVCYLASIPRSQKQVLRDRAFFVLAGIKEFYGFTTVEDEEYRQRLNGLPDPKFRHQAHFRLNRLVKDGITTGPSDLAIPFVTFSPQQEEKVTDWLSAQGLGERPFIALAMKSAQPAKDWPVERIEALGRTLLEEGWGDIVMCGGPGDREMAASLIQKWGRGANACGPFDPLESGALMKRSRLTIGLDTGTTQMAWASGGRVVALFSDHAYQADWEPYGDHAKVVRVHVPCGGCKLQACPKEDHPCMRGITVEMALKAARELLEKG